MLFGSILLGAALLGQTPAVAELELADHTGGADRLAAHRGEVVVVMIVTAKRLRNLKGWERELRDRYDEIHYLRIADIPEEPPVTYEQVAKKLSTRVPEDVPILIDLDRRWATELELDTSRPNLLLIDRAGKLVASFRGRMEPALLEELLAALDPLVEPR
jgi:hypothetical protein